MKWELLLLLLTVGAALTFYMLPAAEVPEAVRQELAKFQGSWKFEVLEEDGQSPPAETVQRLVLTITGNRYVVTMAGEQVSSGTFVIDPHAKTIDRTDYDSDGKEETFYGIYQIDGPTLRVCWSPPGRKERPTSFQSPRGSGLELDVLKKLNR